MKSTTKIKSVHPIFICIRHMHPFILLLLINHQIHSFGGNSAPIIPTVAGGGTAGGSRAPVDALSKT